MITPTFRGMSSIIDHARSLISNLSAEIQRFESDGHTDHRISQCFENIQSEARKVALFAGEDIKIPCKIRGKE